MDEAERLLRAYRNEMFLDRCSKNAAEAEAAVLAAMRKGGVPEGWALVPKAPTVTMLEAADKEPSPGYAYIAMLAAAPKK